MSANPAPVIPPAVNATLATALSALGPWGALAGLALVYGEPFVEGIIYNSHNNTPVNPDTWASQRALIKTDFQAL